LAGTSYFKRHVPQNFANYWKVLKAGEALSQYSPVCVQFINMPQTLFELGSVFTGHSPINSSLDFINRMLAAAVHERRNIKILPKMLQNMADDDETGGFPNTSENTSYSFKLDTVRQLEAWFFSPVMLKIREAEKTSWSGMLMDRPNAVVDVVFIGSIKVLRR